MFESKNFQEKFCPNQTGLCESFRNNVTGTVIRDTMVELINDGTYNDANETSACNGSSMLFVNGTMSAAPAYRISVLKHKIWEQVGTYACLV